MKKVRYVCSHCGKRVVLGEHFCPKSPLAEKERADAGGVEASVRTPDPDSSADSPESDTGRPGPSNRLWVFVAGVLLFVIGLRILGPGVIWLVVIGGLVAVGLYLVQRFLPGLFAPGYPELLQMVGDQRDVAERLIQAERERTPGIKRRDAVEAALDKLKYERMR